MKVYGVALALALAGLIVCGKGVLADPARDVIGKFSAAWGGIKTYECTITAHEVKGTRVQDRVYRIRFSKPLNTRMDVIGGDGRGSAAVWDGRERVRGHQGGILSAIKLNLDIHSRLATSIRGATIAQANYGSLLNHLKLLNPNDLRVTTDGDKTVMIAHSHYPPPDTDVTKEVYIFGSDGLPMEYVQYAGKDLVKRVVYSELKLNIDIPASTWHI